ncbi:hypothetical protein PoB_005241000 [Plakobranchus ocellatus]|uniref:Uncharacterized protein n=1 Tax=Plakobranchus ocellatus TaxID=259542 RepID=A0AAV4C3E9_9GAST|nr:hypothetical protein PoB_005241000 [Plakobranchus ocellatus]
MQSPASLRLWIRTGDRHSSKALRNKTLYDIPGLIVSQSSFLIKRTGDQESHWEELIEPAAGPRQSDRSGRQACDTNTDKGSQPMAIASDRITIRTDGRLIGMIAQHTVCARWGQLRLNGDWV